MEGTGESKVEHITERGNSFLESKSDMQKILKAFIFNEITAQCYGRTGVSFDPTPKGVSFIYLFKAFIFTCAGEPRVCRIILASPPFPHTPCTRWFGGRV